MARRKAHTHKLTHLSSRPESCFYLSIRPVQEQVCEVKEMANAVLPQYVVVRQYSTNKDKPAYYKNDGSDSVLVGGQDVFSPYVKVEVEQATDPASNYVHLRFCCRNRYWQMSESDNSSIVAVSKERDEDTSKPSCTLFEAVKASGDGNAFYLVHVQSGGHVKLDTGVGRVKVDDGSGLMDEFDTLELLDWETLVKLPAHVTFKNEAGYLRGFQYEGGNYLQFGPADPNDVSCGHWVELMPDGYIKLYSDFYKNYWANMNGNFIYGDGSTDGVHRLFWPVKIDDNTIALRSELNQKFVRALSDDYQVTKNCLYDRGESLTKDVRFQVEERVMKRKIYYVQYMMEDARIFDEAPYLAGTAMIINDGDTESSESVTITYEDSKSYTFSRGFSVTAGVSTEIKCGVPFLAEGRVEVSFSITGNFQWDDTTTITSSVAATGTVVVPAHSYAIVDYVGTKGTCEVPYSYTQLDKSSLDGTSVRSHYSDGIYTGVSCYNFNFHIRKQALI